MTSASEVRPPPADVVLGSIAALTDDGILTIGPGGTPLDLNRAAASMLGWQRTRPMRGRSLEQIFSRARPRDVRGRPVTATDLLSRAASPSGYQVQLSPPRRVPGRWVRVSSTKASPGATVVLMRDISALVATESFLGVLSHELRTPVTTILGGSKVLRHREHLPVHAREELVADIEAESERLYRLVEDLMVLARFEHGHPEAIADEPLLLQRILPELVASEQACWPGRRFMTRIPTGLMTVRGDRTYADQVVRNLLVNAAKYSPGDTMVEIEAEAASDEVIVRILDRGRGFAPEEADKLFELYYRSPATAKLAAGAGIGLSVCRRLVEAMGGRIWAHPREGGGAEFGFALRVLNEGEE
ncbi:MAG: ATP-binding protein [Chloroflexota bacterium]